MRITKGRSVMAACGQLGNVELRERQRAERRAENEAREKRRLETL